MYSTTRHAFLAVSSPSIPQLSTPRPIRTFHQQGRAGIRLVARTPRKRIRMMGTPVEADTQKIRQQKSFSRIATQPNAILAIGITVELRPSLAAHLCLRVEFARVTYCMMEVE
ncbi:hypothetical protein MSAN_02021400 [Mycena sanguinolenta]|uniref:Uncharacterized protein n=1 Tax=Mycena sanguinolenta TaxID=230812 RepID=A0A8H6XJD9_9AGAR|nr:hypothetical protein MSAN_02021400 [Mycena sanguinolenta]